MATTAKKKIIYPLPALHADATKEQRSEHKAALSHVRGSRWIAPRSEVPAGEMFPGVVYEVSAAYADTLVGSKEGWRYAGKDGKPTDEKAPEVTNTPRPGQEGYVAPEVDDDADPEPAKPAKQPAKPAKQPAKPAKDNTTTEQPK